MDDPGLGDFPPRWIPVKTSSARANVCSIEAEPLPLLPPFSKQLVFVPRRTVDATDTAGVEWGFVNPDMVIQQGGFRFIPMSSL